VNVCVKKVMRRWSANKWNNIINYVNDAYINKQNREMRKREKDQMSFKKVYIYINYLLLSLNYIKNINNCTLTLILLTWKIRWASNNASIWQMGFNSAFKGLIISFFSALLLFLLQYNIQDNETKNKPKKKIIFLFPLLIVIKNCYKQFYNWNVS